MIAWAVRGSEQCNDDATQRWTFITRSRFSRRLSQISANRPAGCIICVLGQCCLVVRCCKKEWKFAAVNSQTYFKWENYDLMRHG